MKPIMALSAISLLFVSIGAQAALSFINYCKDLTDDQFLGAATASITRMGYKIEQQSPGNVTGRSRNATGNATIVITMPTPGRIVINFLTVAGGIDTTEARRQLKNKMLWALASESRPGEVTINWCKDLTTEKFHSVALEALHNRRYTIEKDTPDSLIGAQKKYKVEVAMDTPGRIVIRWVPGFGYRKNNWLNNLYESITWSLAQ